MTLQNKQITNCLLQVIPASNINKIFGTSTPFAVRLGKTNLEVMDYSVSSSKLTYSISDTSDEPSSATNECSSLEPPKPTYIISNTSDQPNDMMNESSPLEPPGSNEIHSENEKNVNNASDLKDHSNKSDTENDNLVSGNSQNVEIGKNTSDGNENDFNDSSYNPIDSLNNA